MKVLHIAKFYYPYAGGMESIIKDLCEGVANRGHEVTVLCSHDKMSFDEDRIKGVRVIRLPLLFKLFGQNINYRILRTLRELAAEHDIVHFHGPNPLFEFMSLFLSKDRPFVNTYHSDIIRQKNLLKVYRPFFNRFLDRLDSVFVPTVNHIKFSPFLSPRERKCHLVPFGISDEHLKETDNSLVLASEFRSKYGPYCIFIGRIVGYKGLPVLLKAMREVKGKLLVIGDGPDRFQCEQLLDDYKLRGKVIFLGKVMDRDQFAGLIQGSEFLVLPSITSNENFGIVQLEAMACSKPVVTTNLKSGVPAVGTEGETTLLSEPGDFVNLAKNLNTLFGDHCLAHGMGQKARERFDEIYTLEHMIDIQIEEYQKLLK